MELAVIAAAALFMAEYMVSLIQLYKAAVQGWVPRVSVRVKLFGLGEKSSFNFFRTGTRMHAQQFIIITWARPLPCGRREKPNWRAVGPQMAQAQRQQGQ